MISGGRAILGIGAAWNEEEHTGYGYDFPPMRERMDRLEEALTIIQAMFTEERPSFDGEHYRIEQALNSPRPIQAGGPPILVGGGGEQRTLRIAAKHADMTHWFPLGLDALRHKNEVLDRLLRGDRAGPGRRSSERWPRRSSSPARKPRRRPPSSGCPPERRRVVSAGTPEQAAEILRPYLEAGFTGSRSTTCCSVAREIAEVGEVLRLIGG